MAARRWCKFAGEKNWSLPGLEGWPGHQHVGGRRMRGGRGGEAERERRWPRVVVADGSAGGPSGGWVEKKKVVWRMKK